MFGYPQQSPIEAQFAATFGRQQMFGAPDAMHRYTGPFNVDLSQHGAMGLMTQLGMPVLMNSLMAKHQLQASQFLPQQNLYDQMLSNRFYEAQQSAMAAGAQRDTAAIQDLMGGTTRLMTGAPLTAGQIQQQSKMARTVSGMMPLLAQMFGADTIDQLYGSRGSATLLAQQVHQHMQHTRDPVTGRVGASAESAGVISQEVFEQLFGRGATVAQMRGITAGQAGVMFGELQQRGMLGPAAGTLPLSDRLANLPGRMDSGTIARLAERLPDIKKIRESGRDPTAAEMDTAKGRIDETHLKMVTDQAKLTAKEIDRLPGGQDILRASDAKRITDRLKNLSGAVSAMRDIFGDMGRPNAPMRELMNGLDALTQGGMANMSPAALEDMVRRTHSIAKQTGIGMQGMIGLTAQGAELADRLGLDRGYAVQATQGAAAYGAAAGDIQRLDIPRFGSLSREQITLADQQLRLTAAASPVNNQLAALLRMQDEGTIQREPDHVAPTSQTQALARAVRDGSATYTWDGSQHSVAMSRNEFTQMLGRDTGLTTAAVFRSLRDTYGNQEYGERYRTQDVVRQAQRRDIMQKTTSAFGGSAQGEFAAKGADEELKAAGVTTDSGDFRRFMESVGKGVSQDFFAMDDKTARTKELQSASLAKSYDTHIRNEIARRLGKPATAPEVDAAYQRVKTRLGGEAGIQQLATTGYKDLNAYVRGDPLTAPYKSAEGLRQMHNDRTFAEQRKRERESIVDADTRSALSGLGTAGPISRLVDTLSGARPDTEFSEVAARVLGGVDLAKIAARDQGGAVAGLLGLIKDNQKLDSSNEADFIQLRRNTRIMRALNEGGELALAEIKSLKADPGHDPKLLERLQRAYDTGGIRNWLEEQGYMATALVGETEIKATTDMGRRANKLLGQVTSKSTVEEIKAAQTEAGGFVGSAGERTRAMIMDDRSMEQLGTGGLSLVRGVQQKEVELRELAAVTSKKLGRTVSVGELLTGGQGIDAGAVKTAKQAYAELQVNMEEINRRRGYHMLPKRGEDPANLAREVRTDAEKRETDAEREFLQRHQGGPKMTAAEEMAATLADRLLSIADDNRKSGAGLTTRDTLSVASNRQKLIDEIAAGGTERAVGVHRAVTARDGLVKLARQKGLVGVKATAHEENLAIDKLSGLTLTATEQQDYSRMQRDYSQLRGFGDTGDVTDSVDAATNRIRGFRGVEQTAVKEDQDKKLAVTITGSLVVDDEGNGKIAANGEGILDALGARFS